MLSKTNKWRKLLTLMNVVICDDNATFIRLFKNMMEAQFALRDWQFQFCTYQSGQDLLEADLSTVHAVFLDIDMPGMNGIQVAKQIRERYPEMVIIFVTAFLQYAVDGYSVEALRYLLKSNLTKELPPCLDAIYEKVFTTQETILLRNTSSNTTARLKDILYLEGTPQAHTIVHFNSRNTVDCIGKISEYEDILSDKGFLRIQRSYLVNCIHITGLCSYTATLINGETLSISRKRYRQICTKYMKWKGHHI